MNERFRLGARPWRAVLIALPAAILVPARGMADPPSLLERRIVALATRLAVSRAGLSSEPGREMAVRARAAGWVPQVHLRVRRGIGTSATSDYQIDRATTGDSLVLDASLVFSLDRVVFDSSEIAIARLEAERSARRAEIERQVLEALGAMERARVTARRAEPGSPEVVSADLDFARARARLESLTGVALDEILRRR